VWSGLESVGWCSNVLSDVEKCEVIGGVELVRCLEWWR